MSTAHTKNRWRFSLASVFLLVSLIAIFIAAVVFGSAWRFLVFFVACSAWATRVRYLYIRRSLLLLLAGWVVICLGCIPIELASDIRPRGEAMLVSISFASVLFGGSLVFSGGFALLANLLDRNFEQ